MSAAETSIIPTILDYLNEDCWQALLDYVPVRDIIRSEGVSKRWQSLVLEYLRHVRIGLKKDHSPSLDSIPLSNVYWLTLKEADSSFRMWTNKLGSSVVAAYCDTEMKFHVIGENCPNLEAVMFYELPETVLNQYYENFKWVHWLSINRCFRVSESCMSRYICGASIKELQLICNEVTSGQCLRSIKSINLTSLSIHQCERLQFHHLLAAGDRLRGLTKLSLLDVSTETYNNIHLLLDKTPKLDHLLVYIYSHNFRDPIRKDELFPAVCRLTGLKRFGTDMGGTEGDLEAVTRCCKELHSLLVEDCLVSLEVLRNKLQGIRTLKENTSTTADGGNKNAQFV